MPTVTIDEAQARLPQLIEQLGPGEALIITRDERPVARLTGAEGEQKHPRKLGTMRGTVLRVAEDFDAPLEDFREYLK